MRFASARILAVFLALLVPRVTILSAGIQEVWEQRPDQVLQPAVPRTIKAGAALDTYRFELSTDQIKDRWIRAIDFRPGNPRVVLRAFFYVARTGQWLGAWVPGQKLAPFPETVAAVLPAGSKVLMEVQYKSVQEDVTDRSSLALYFTDRKPLRPLSGMGIHTRVLVPAATNRYTIRREFAIISDSYALALRPEMLAAGRSVEVTSVDPAGISQILISVKEFNKDVQPPYVFEEPLFLPKGTRIAATASYENFDAEPTEDLFKLTMSIYPSGEVRPSPDAARAPVVRRAPARKAPVRKAPAKKAPVKKAPAKKP